MQNGDTRLVVHESQAQQIPWVLNDDASRKKACKQDRQSIPPARPAQQGRPRLVIYQPTLYLYGQPIHRPSRAFVLDIVPKVPRLKGPCISSQQDSVMPRSPTQLLSRIGMKPNIPSRKTTQTTPTAASPSKEAGWKPKKGAPCLTDPVRRRHSQLPVRNGVLCGVGGERHQPFHKQPLLHRIQRTSNKSSQPAPARAGGVQVGLWLINPTDAGARRWPSRSGWVQGPSLASPPKISRGPDPSHWHSRHGSGCL